MGDSLGLELLRLPGLERSFRERRICVCTREGAGENVRFGQSILLPWSWDLKEFWIAWSGLQKCPDFRDDRVILSLRWFYFKFILFLHPLVNYNIPQVCELLKESFYIIVPRFF